MFTKSWEGGDNCVIQQHAGGLVGHLEDREVEPEWSGVQGKLQGHTAVQGQVC